MIKFFRHIRQNMIDKNRIAKYLLYALGEIVLVVIGILIALQLNIQREAAKEKKVTEQLLVGIQADLKLELERVELLNSYYSEVTDGIQQILLNHQRKERNTNKELGQYFMNSFEFRKFSKINANYQTLYGSGLLQGIDDKNLAEEIITYYSKQYLEWSLEIYQEKAGAFDFNRSTNFSPLDKLRANSGYQYIPNFRLDVTDPYATDFQELINEPEVLNFLTDLLHQSELVFANLKNYRESNQNLSNHIQRYLEQ
jgi:hypothetical protein